MTVAGSKPSGAPPSRLPNRSHFPTTRLLTLSELPLWMRDNDYLRTSYRPPQPSMLSCLYTGLLQLNNDTVNIYTHALPFILLIPLSYHLLGPALSLSSLSSKLPSCPRQFHPPTLDFLRQYGLRKACLFTHPATISPPTSLSTLLNAHRHGLLPLIIAGMLCMAFSASFHIFWVHSPRVCSVFAKLDFLGIAVLCSGHAFTGIFHAFYCRPHMATPFYILIAIALSLTVPAIFSPFFATPRARPLRAVVFASLGSTSLLPLAQAAYYASSFPDRLAIVGALIALLFYAVGAAIYVTRFPECCRIGHHDRFFASHQLMHVAVVAGLAIHLAFCFYLARLRIQFGCIPS